MQALLPELWRQVTESPDDLVPRLVLADALIEAGDPRGELIALQCGGADASVQVLRDDEPVHDNTAERLNELVAAHWDAWLGDLALVIHRQGSQFRNGMLASILVGSDDPVPEAIWDAVGTHRELCALQQVRPHKVNPERYGRFLAALTRDPPWVELPQGTLASLRARRSQWSVRAVRCSHWLSSDGPAPDLVLLAELAPNLERLEFASRWIPREWAPMVTAVIEKLPHMFPRLAAIHLEDAGGMLRDLDARQRAQLAAHPLVELGGSRTAARGSR